jgi:hypothetical protein
MLKNLNDSDIYSLTLAAYAGQLFKQKQAQGLYSQALPQLDTKLGTLLTLYCLLSKNNYRCVTLSLAARAEKKLPIT